MVKTINKYLLLVYLLLLCSPLQANGIAEKSLPLQTDSITEKKNFWKQLKRKSFKLLKSFSDVDTNYIEPQHYKFTVMLQNTNTFERYRLKNTDKQSITLAPSPSIKVGPYMGYEWIFLGYTVDLNNFNNNKERTEIDLSLYTSRLGIDLFYRKTGNNYRIKNIFIDNHVNTKPLEGMPFKGFNSSIKGFNLYFIFNHKRFSYPAAFSQSTVQRKSAGSPLMGIGYTQHRMHIDLIELNQLVSTTLYPNSQPIPSYLATLSFGNYQYTDFAISGGYAYNWVFAHNWLFASSLSLALGYKRSDSHIQRIKNTSVAYHVSNIDLDAIGRFALVWNNTKWYAGASTIFHNYRYHQDQLTSNTLFGSFNIYVGINFGKYKNK